MGGGGGGKLSDIPINIENALICGSLQLISPIEGSYAGDYQITCNLHFSLDE